MLPKAYRTLILKTAHKIHLAGYLGVIKSYEKIVRHLYWPGMMKDVGDFCNNYAICQSAEKSNVKFPKAPLHPIPVCEETFSRVIINCKGTLPRTKRGNKYILTILCGTSIFPKTIPLKNISTRNIIGAHLFIESGLPKEIHSDQWSTFIYRLFL